MCTFLTTTEFFVMQAPVLVLSESSSPPLLLLLLFPSLLIFPYYYLLHLFSVSFVDTSTQRETGRTAQVNNINAAKVLPPIPPSILSFIFIFSGGG
jgi:hypothetical protein